MLGFLVEGHEYGNWGTPQALFLEEKVSISEVVTDASRTVTGLLGEITPFNIQNNSYDNDTASFHSTSTHLMCGTNQRNWKSV